MWEGRERRGRAGIDVGGPGETLEGRERRGRAGRDMGGRHRLGEDRRA